MSSVIYSLLHKNKGGVKRSGVTEMWLMETFSKAGLLQRELSTKCWLNWDLFSRGDYFK